MFVLMLTMILSVAEMNDNELPANLSDLYGKALTAMIRRLDQHRKGAGGDAAEVEQILQRLAFHSHIRDSQFRNFTTSEASGWLASGTAMHEGGWAQVSALVRRGRLPLLVALEKNAGDEEEYRFSHLTFQEFLTAKGIVELVERQRTDEEAKAELVRVLGVGDKLERAFEQAKWQLVLRTCADLLVSAGELQRMSVLLLGSGEGSFKKGGKELGARALEPYLCANHQLTSLKFEEGDLGDAGLRILVDGDDGPRR